MRYLVPSGVLCLLPALCAPPLAAAPGEPPVEPWELARRPSQPSQSAPQTPPPVALDHDHRFQVGLAVRAGTGYRIIAPYGEGQPCGEADERVCDGRTPFWIEVSPSFGVTRWLELLLDVRFSPEADFTDTRSYQFSPGLKFYASARERFKVYGTAQLVLDFQKQVQGTAVREFDAGLRSAVGVQFDFNRHVGLMAQGAVTLGFARWFSFAVNFGLGVQARY